MSDVGQSQPTRLDLFPDGTVGGKNWSFTFASPRRLAQVVVALFALLIVLDLATIGVLQSRIELAGRVENGAAFTTSELSAADDRVSLALLAWLVGLVVTTIAFIWWFRRVYGNVGALGARDLRFGHGWSVGAWFVPILNLFRPFQIAQDSWQASDPELDPVAGASWRGGSRSAIVGAWWTVFIISGVIDRIAAAQPTETADDLISADRMLMASNLVDVVAAALAIAFVLRLTSRQRARAERLAIAQD